MNWSPLLPTIPGYYWYRVQGDTLHDRIVRIYKESGLLQDLLYIDWLNSCSACTPLGTNPHNENKALWAGPISKPL